MLYVQRGRWQIAPAALRHQIMQMTQAVYLS